MVENGNASVDLSPVDVEVGDAYSTHLLFVTDVRVVTEGMSMDPDGKVAFPDGDGVNGVEFDTGRHERCMVEGELPVRSPVVDKGVRPPGEVSAPMFTVLVMTVLRKRMTADVGGNAANGLDNML